jgi:hypothetical protein
MLLTTGDKKMGTSSIESLTINSSSLSTPAQQAQELYEKAIDLLEGGSSLCNTDDSMNTAAAKAQEYISQAIALDPSYPGFYIVQGALDLYNLNSESAHANFSKAIELDSLFADDHFEMGLVFALRALAQCFPQLNKEDFEKALADLKVAEELGLENIDMMIDFVKAIIEKLDARDQKMEELQTLHSTFKMDATADLLRRFN